MYANMSCMVVSQNTTTTCTQKRRERSPEVNTGSMDVREELDIYIPKEAKVRTIPLNRLPRPVLRKMGVPLPDRKSADSPDVIWICPAVMKTKGQGPASHRDGDLLEKLRIRSNTLQMSFVSSNHTAWELLKDISSGARSFKTQLAHQDSVPEADQNVLVIYQGRIYLCMKRSTRNQGQPKTCKLQPTCRPAGPSTSELRSPSPVQEPASDGRQKMNRVAGEKEDVLKGRAMSLAWDTHLLPPSSDSERGPDGPGVAVPEPEPVPEAAPQHRNATDDVEYESRHDGAAGSAWSVACDSEQNSPDRSLEQTWAVRDTLGAASSLRREFDFKELENEEKIAQLKAKFMQDRAALNNLLC